MTSLDTAIAGRESPGVVIGASHVPLSARKVLFDGHAILGRLFTLPGWKVFLILSVPALVLNIAAWPVHVHSIPFTLEDAHTTINLGFWRSYNWSLMYLVGVPLAVATAAYMMRDFHGSIDRLSTSKAAVFVDTSGGPALDYAEDLSRRIAASSVTLAHVVVSSTVLILLLDTWDLWIGMYNNYQARPSWIEFPPSLLKDWDTAFRLQYANGLTAPTITANIIFDIVAYLFEGTAIYLAVFWLGKTFVSLKAFADSMTGTSTYQFKPIVTDSRLGLRWMGGVFDKFIAIILGFQAYAFLHRLQLAGRGKDGGLGRYVLDLITAAHDPTRLVALQRSGTMDLGMYCVLLAIGASLIAIVYLPLFKIRRYVMRRRDEARMEYSRQLEAAKEADDTELARRLEKDLQIMQGASVWPNGDAKAWVSLFAAGVLGVGVLSPPLCVWLVAIGGVAVLARWVVSKRGQA